MLYLSWPETTGVTVQNRYIRQYFPQMHQDTFPPITYILSHFGMWTAVRRGYVMCDWCDAWPRPTGNEHESAVMHLKMRNVISEAISSNLSHYWIDCRPHAFTLSKVASFFSSVCVSTHMLCFCNCNVIHFSFWEYSGCNVPIWEHVFPPDIGGEDEERIKIIPLKRRFSLFPAKGGFHYSREELKRFFAVVPFIKNSMQPLKSHEGSQSHTATLHPDSPCLT